MVCMRKGLTCGKDRLRGMRLETRGNRCELKKGLLSDAYEKSHQNGNFVFCSTRQNDQFAAICSSGWWGGGVLQRSCVGKNEIFV